MQTLHFVLSAVLVEFPAVLFEAVGFPALIIGELDGHLLLSVRHSSPHFAAVTFRHPSHPDEFEVHTPVSYLIPLSLEINLTLFAFHYLVG